MVNDRDELGGGYLNILSSSKRSSELLPSVSQVFHLSWSTQATVGFEHPSLCLTLFQVLLRGKRDSEG